MRTIFTSFSHVTAPPAILTNKRGLPLMQTAGQLAHLVLYFSAHQEVNIDSLKGTGKRIMAGLALDTVAKIPPWIGRGADNIASAARVYDQWQELRNASLGVTYAWHGVSREKLCSKLTGMNKAVSQNTSSDGLIQSIKRFVLELLKFIVYLDDFHRSLQTSENRSYLIVENGYQVLEVARKHRVEFDALMANAGLPRLELIEVPIKFLEDPILMSCKVAVAAQTQGDQLVQGFFGQSQ